MVRTPNPPKPPAAATATKSEEAVDPRLVSLVPIARSSVVDAVADRLQAEILAGRLPAGSRLPSERELSLALGVNRLTLRAALARLEALGLITTRHGAGTLVASWRERAGLDTLPSLVASLSPGEPAWKKLIVDILEVRRVLASECVALATLRHTEADLAVLATIRDEQRTRLHDAIAYARGDMAFQRALVRAAGNVGLELVLNSFARFPDEHPELVARLYDRRDRAVELYDGMLAILVTRDAELARTQVRAAFEAMDAEWLSRHAPEDDKPQKTKSGSDGALARGGAEAPRDKKRAPGKGKKKS